MIPEGPVTSEVLEAVVTDLITARCTTLDNCPHTDADTARRCSRCYRSLLWWGSRGWASTPRSLSGLLPCCYFRKERISNKKRMWTWIARRGRFVMEAMSQWEIELSAVRGNNLPGALVTGRGSLAPHGTRSAVNARKYVAYDLEWILHSVSHSHLAVVVVSILQSCYCYLRLASPYCKQRNRHHLDSHYESIPRNHHQSPVDCLY